MSQSGPASSRDVLVNEDGPSKTQRPPVSQNPSLTQKNSNRSLSSASSTEYSLGHERDVEKADNASQPEAEAATQSKDPHLVDWDGSDDPENPQNWPKTKKWLVTMCLASITLTITFASSVFSTGTIIVSEQFNVGTEIGILGTSLFVLGFAFGPIA
jgi:MFS transporter, DHA1 family, multidrug resistance protein